MLTGCGIWKPEYNYGYETIMQNLLILWIFNIDYNGCMISENNLIQNSNFCTKHFVHNIHYISF